MIPNIDYSIASATPARYPVSAMGDADFYDTFYVDYNDGTYAEYHYDGIKESRVATDSPGVLNYLRYDSGYWYTYTECGVTTDEFIFLF